MATTDILTLTVKGGTAVKFGEKPQGNSGSNLWSAGAAWRGPMKTEGLTSMRGANYSRLEQTKERLRKFGVSEGEIKAFVGEKKFNEAARPSIGTSYFQALDPKGQPLTESQYVNFNGVSYYAPNGVVKTHDSEYFEEELKLAEEVDVRVKTITKLCLSGDAQCAELLTNNNVGILKELLDGPGSKDAFKTHMGALGHEGDISDLILSAYAMPSTLQAVSPNSDVYSFGISKLKMLAKAVMPIMVNVTNDTKYDSSRQDTTNINKKGGTIDSAI